MFGLPGDSRLRESPENEDNDHPFFILNIVPLIIKNFTKYLKTRPSEWIHAKKSPEKLCRCP